MIKKTIITLGVVLGFVGAAFAQTDSTDFYDLPRKYRVVGLNTTPLLAQLVPFNRTNPQLSGPYVMTYRSFTGRNAFRFGLGMNLSEVDSNNGTLNLNMRFGWQRKKSFYERWSYGFGLDFFIVTGGFNTVGSQREFDEDGGFGLGPVWEMEYAINKRVRLSIESTLFLGGGFDTGAVFTFIPPVALYLNFVIPKRNRFKR